MKITTSQNNNTFKISIGDVSLELKILEWDDKLQTNKNKMNRGFKLNAGRYIIQLVFKSKMNTKHSKEISDTKHRSDYLSGKGLQEYSLNWYYENYRNMNKGMNN